MILRRREGGGGGGDLREREKKNKGEMGFWIVETKIILRMMTDLEEEAMEAQDIDVKLELVPKMFEDDLGTIQVGGNWPRQ